MSGLNVIGLKQEIITIISRVFNLTCWSSTCEPMTNSVTTERVSTSHSLQVLSPDAVNSCLPSGFHATYNNCYRTVIYLTMFPITSLVTVDLVPRLILQYFLASPVYKIYIKHFFAAQKDQTDFLMNCKLTFLNI